MNKSEWISKKIFLLTTYFLTGFFFLSFTSAYLMEQCLHALRRMTVSSSIKTYHLFHFLSSNLVFYTEKCDLPDIEVVWLVRQENCDCQMWY